MEKKATMQEVTAAITSGLLKISFVKLPPFSREMAFCVKKTNLINTIARAKGIAQERSLDLMLILEVNDGKTIFFGEFIEIARRSDPLGFSTFGGKINRIRFHDPGHIVAKEPLTNARTPGHDEARLLISFGKFEGHQLLGGISRNVSTTVIIDGINLRHAEGPSLANLTS